ncbi:nucleotide-sugar transporter family protein [Actinidia rufa]|uniref:Nucleotide-sugar transporter family protein n=1 Tax=Actinidia rufa TaxID=165716 RepID=A0A7J0GJ74_9ERIC|nr:nucleotide-sugar transporter family protein [Actinidia rufa]
MKNGMIECSVCHSKLVSPNTKAVSRAYDKHRSKISSKQRALNILLVVGDCILVGLQPILVFMSKVDGKFKFSPISVNFLTEAAKVVFAIVMLLFQARRQKVGEKPLLSISTFVQSQNGISILELQNGIWLELSCRNRRQPCRSSLRNAILARKRDGNAFPRGRIALLRKMGAYRNKSDANRTHPSQIELNRASLVSNRGKSRTNRSSGGFSKSGEVNLKVTGGRRCQTDDLGSDSKVTRGQDARGDSGKIESNTSEVESDTHELNQCSYSLIGAWDEQIEVIGGLGTSGDPRLRSPEDCGILAARSNALLAVPALLYAINNYLKFIMQLYFNPATVKMLSNLKVLVIAVLLKMIMKRRFSIIQWEALALLLIGISINQLRSLPDGTTALGLPIATGAYMYTLIFVTVPSLASVFNEYALKSQYDTSIYLQNLFLYGYGAIFNFLAILGIAIFKGPSSFDILQGHSKATMLLIFNNAAQGILSSFFFKYADTILKKYSSTVATIFTGIASAALFGHTLTINFMLGISVVFISMHQFFSSLSKAKDDQQTGVLEQVDVQDTHRLFNPLTFNTPRFMLMILLNPSLIGWAIL